MTAFATRPHHARRALRGPLDTSPAQRQPTRSAPTRSAPTRSAPTRSVPIDYDRWQDVAACQGMDASTFYAHDGQRAASLRRHEEAAKQICATCPVQRECLQYALGTREAWGVWGGKTAEERQAMGWRPSTARPFSVAG